MTKDGKRAGWRKNRMDLLSNHGPLNLSAPALPHCELSHPPYVSFVDSRWYAIYVSQWNDVYTFAICSYVRTIDSLFGNRMCKYGRSCIVTMNTSLAKEVRKGKKNDKIYVNYLSQTATRASLLRLLKKLSITSDGDLNSFYGRPALWKNLSAKPMHSYKRGTTLTWLSRNPNLAVDPTPCARSPQPTTQLTPVKCIYATSFHLRETDARVWWRRKSLKAAKDGNEPS